MHESFVDFLNHGTLPFTGRAEETEAILRFWRERDRDRTELQAMLIRGEAGVGKSRLIEELIPQVEATEGAVVHLRLRPEGSVSLGPLLAAGIERSATASALTPRIVAPTLPNCIGILRRLCALRRTLLIIEDIHLLEGGTLREFAMLVESLGNEPMALLVAARPLELPARGIIEGYLTDELTLEGLPDSHVALLWSSLFSAPPSPQALGILMAATKGNVLAVRAAVRAGVRWGSITQEGYDPSGGVKVNLGAFRQVAELSTGGVIQGMVADLSPQQMEEARTLAMLGEVFSEEAAAQILPNAHEAINALIFKGVLAHSTTPVAALNNQQSNGLPIAFTHTLLHQGFIGTGAAAAPGAIGRLVRAIGLNLPIYSFLPLLQFRTANTVEGCTAAEVIACADQMHLSMRHIDGTPDWGRSSEILESLESLVRLASAKLLSPETQDEQQGLLIARRLELRNRNTTSEEYRSMAQQLLQLAESGARLPMLQLRLVALNHLYRHAVGDAQREEEGFAKQMELLVAQHPELRGSYEYVRFLGDLTVHAHNTQNVGRMRELEEVIVGLTNDATFQEGFRHTVFVRLMRSTLLLINNPEELARRQQLLAKLEQFNPTDLDLQVRKGTFLYATNCSDALLQQSARLLPALRQRGLFGPYYATRMHQLIAEGMTGTEPDQLLKTATELLSEATQKEYAGWLTEARCQQMVGESLMQIALYCNRPELAGFAAERCFQSANGDPAIGLALATRRGDRTAAAAQVSAIPHNSNPDLPQLFNICWDGSGSPAKFWDELALFLDEPVISLLQFRALYPALELLSHAKRAGSVAIPSPIERGVATLVRRLLDWYAERQLPAPIAALLNCHGQWLSAQEMKEWKKREMEMERLRQKQRKPTQQGSRLAISMIDIITTQPPEQKEPARLRGGRNQALLGLLVAARMLRKPLDKLTFNTLASGIEGDPERARVTANVAVMRLREAIGRDAVVTGPELPELNLEEVTVDLLEAWGMLKRAESSLRRGRLVAARESAIGAVRIAAGRVPFPALYDELFETLRDEFESRLRQTVLGTVAALRREGDAEGAASLMQEWTQRVPEEEMEIEE
ncbi:MAG: AAA family ATPase [Candidatus Kapabacteria bacterium]|nr:AAA family ATPase [Candidatus Kapabacteria bacterium]